MKLTVPMLVLAVGLATGSRAFADNTSTASGTRSTTVLSDGAHEVRVDSDGSTAKVMLDGKLVASLDVTGGWTEHKVVDADGNVVATLWRDGHGGSISAAMGDRDGTSQARNFSTTDWQARGGQWAARLAQAMDDDDVKEHLQVAKERMESALARYRAEMPKVMIGVTMSNTEDVSVGSAGYDIESTTTIDSVVDDGPAAKAGLQAGDVIVAFDGSTDADFETIRETLRKHDPGDTVAVAYLRGGQKQEGTITLEPYSAKAFGMNVFNQDFDPTMVIQNLGFSNEDVERIQAEIAELSAKLEKLSDELATAVGNRAQEIGKLASEIGQQIAVKAADLARQSAAELTTRLWSPRNGGQGGSIIRIVPDDKGAPRGIFVPTPAPPAPSAPSPNAAPAPGAPSPANAETQARLERLEAQNAELKAMIEKLLQQQQRQNTGGGNR